MTQMNNNLIETVTVELDGDLCDVENVSYGETESSVIVSGATLIEKDSVAALPGVKDEKVLEKEMVVEEREVNENAVLLEESVEEGVEPVVNPTATTCCIHGVWYDLTEFEHPGGPVALKLAKDRDATASYEMHHPFSNEAYMKRTLEKYKLTDAEVERRGLILDKSEADEDFVWEEEDAFRKDLVTSVKAYFQTIADENGTTIKDAIKMPWGTWILMWVIATLAVVTYYFYCTGWVWSIFVLPWLVWMFTGRLMHDGSHFSLSRNWRFNQIGTHMAPWYSSSSSWYVQHVIGHHAHTNIPERDPDLYHGKENWRYVPHVDWIPAYRRQHYLWPLIWFGSTITISALAEIFDNVYYNGITLIGDRTTKYYNFWFPARMIIMAILFGVPIVTVGFFQGIIFFLSTWIIMSCIFMAFTQVSHLDELCGTARLDNFWKHQIATTSDYSSSSSFWNVISIGLNCQAIHHSFPTVNTAHFPALYPIFKEVCGRHGVEYQEKANFWEALKEYWRVLALYSRPDEEIAEERALNI
eukprot:TRINITY_DN5826_c0_g1_i1.p1 TRINITY_DN5826_c0_g1~~TRINITY_DN5826_c0_g1_i1.p1  ORF type:complete len:528 (-),score=131.72 TRINITY_DN5826_c0_g1_i1:61-1644(-)